MDTSKLKFKAEIMDENAMKRALRRIAHEIIEKNDGWPYHLLTEDIQFSAVCAASGCAAAGSAFVRLPLGSRSRISPASRMMRTYLYLAAKALSFRVFMMYCSIPAACAGPRGRPR